MEGLIFAAVLIVGVLVLALASMVHAVGQKLEAVDVAVLEHAAALARVEQMLAELPEQLEPAEEEHPLVQMTASEAGRLQHLYGRDALQARNARRGWVKKPQKAKPA